MKKLFIIAYILIFSLNSSIGQTKYVDQYKVMKVLKDPPIGLTLVSAHRGLHYGYDDTPENSMRAIRRAAENSIESIELDIKVTKDGVPILSHDSNLARMTFNSYGPFNSANSNPNPLTYPDISTLNFASITNLKLRKISFDPVTHKNNYTQVSIPINGTTPAHYENWAGIEDNETVASLREALTHIRDYNLKLVVLLDIKSIPDALACWKVVNSMVDCAGKSFAQTVIFKMSFKALGYEDPIKGLINLGLINNLHNPGLNSNMKFVPVLGGSDLDKMEEFYNGGDNYDTRQYYERCIEVMTQYVQGYVYTELNPKRISTGGWFPHLVNIASISQSTGIFNPVREVPLERSFGGDNHGFYENTGRCCYQLSDVLYTSSYYDDYEIDDFRTDVKNSNMSSFNFILTDDPLKVRAYLGEVNRRQNIYKIRSDVDPCGASSGRQSAEETPTDEETKLLLFPNPSVDSFTLQYWADEATEANVKIINSVGQTAMEQNLNFEKGINQPVFNTSSFVGGTYFVNMEVDGKVITRKLMIVK